MILNFVYIGAIFSSIILAIILIYNLVCLLSKHYFSSRHTEKGKTRITSYKRNSLFSSISLIAVLMFIMIYTRPVSFAEVLNISNDRQVNSISIYGNTSGSEVKYLDADDSKELFSFLNSYKYKRTFSISNIGGKGEFLGVDNNFIEIRESGYLRIPNYTVYKVDLKNSDELYDALKRIIISW